MKKNYKIIVGVVVVIVILIAANSFLSKKREIVEQDRLSKPLVGEKIEEMESPHIKIGDSHEPYNSNPPTSGPHVGNGVAGAGIKDKPVADEIVVHSLEHGAVVLWYREDLKQEEIEKLKQVFLEASGKKIMIPRNNMDTPIALTSWGYLLKLQSIDKEKIKEFIETNNDRAPEKAPI
jgi:hypothetical protein